MHRSLLLCLLASGLAFAQSKKILFDHTGYEDAGTSAYWIIDDNEPNPSPVAPTGEQSWNGGISAWAFDLYNKGYVVQTLPASGGRITYNDSTNTMDLKNYAAFIIPERYKRFTSAEMQALAAYVNNGGGIYFMGNHVGASRATSIDPNSTDAYTVFNEFFASSYGTSFGFTFVPGHGPGDSLANTISNGFDTGTATPQNAIIRGANGTLASMDFHSYSYVHLTGSNAGAVPILHTQVSGDDPVNDLFVAAGTVGQGRVVVISDSAPSDDGTTTTSGKSLHVSYSINSNRAFHLNATDWLASGTTSTGNTVTASITTPSSNLSVVSGTPVIFTGTATDSSSTATLTYGWTFGDGGTATGASSSHSYMNTGTSPVTYTATFKATDNTGVNGTATRLITVSPEGPNTVQASITAPSSDQTIASGTTLNFSGIATDTSSTATLTYGWTFGDGGSASGTSASHTFTNTGSSNLAYLVTFRATDNTGSTGSSTRTITVTPATTTTSELIKNGGFEGGSSSWSATSGVIAQNGPSEPAHGGTYDAWLCGYGTSTTDTLYQQVSVPSTITKATLTFWLHIDTAEPTTTAYDKLTVSVQNSSGSTLQTLGTFSNMNAASGYTQYTYDLSAYKGQTIRVYFKGVEDSQKQTSFVIDDVSLKVQ